VRVNGFPCFDGKLSPGRTEQFSDRNDSVFTGYYLTRFLRGGRGKCHGRGKKRTILGNYAERDTTLTLYVKVGRNK